MFTLVHKAGTDATLRHRIVLILSQGFSSRIRGLIWRTAFARMKPSGGGAMKWLKERDELIAQTEAFVKSVTARRPEAAAAPVPMRSAPIENTFGHTAAHPISSSPAPTPSPKQLPTPKPIPIQDLAPDAPIEQPDALPRAEPPPIKAFARGEVRQEIQNRVAAFQANQNRFQREREDYYNSVLTKARSTAHRIPDTSQS